MSSIQCVEPGAAGREADLIHRPGQRTVEPGAAGPIYHWYTCVEPGAAGPIYHWYTVPINAPGQPRT